MTPNSQLIFLSHFHPITLYLHLSYYSQTKSKSDTMIGHETAYMFKQYFDTKTEFLTKIDGPKPKPLYEDIAHTLPTFTPLSKTLYTSATGLSDLKNFDQKNNYTSSTSDIGRLKNLYQNETQPLKPYNAGSNTTSYCP